MCWGKLKQNEKALYSKINSVSLVNYIDDVDKITRQPPIIAENSLETEWLKLKF
jgi:hypothetical protein